MRLKRPSHHHKLRHKLVMGMIRLFTGARALDVVRTLLYRHELFGAPQNALTQALLRGPSDWGVWERELMASFVSKLNQCTF